MGMHNQSMVSGEHSEAFSSQKRSHLFAQLASSGCSFQKQLSKKQTFHSGERNNNVHVLYLRRAFEVHPRNRQSGDVHGNTPVQIECAHNEKEPPTYN